MKILSIKIFLDFFVRECVNDKDMRKELFNILRCHHYIDEFLDKICEFDLYDDFELICGNIYGVAERKRYRCLVRKEMN